jgi:hypothetical protein
MPAARAGLKRPLFTRGGMPLTPDLASFGRANCAVAAKWQIECAAGLCGNTRSICCLPSGSTRRRKFSSGGCRGPHHSRNVRKRREHPPSAAGPETQGASRTAYRPSRLLSGDGRFLRVRAQWTFGSLVNDNDPFDCAVTLSAKELLASTIKKYLDDIPGLDKLYELFPDDKINDLRLNAIEDWRQVHPIGANRGPVAPEVPQDIAQDYIEACNVLPISSNGGALNILLEYPLGISSWIKGRAAPRSFVYLKRDSRRR